jgi:hypothetical protein
LGPGRWTPGRWTPGRVSGTGGLASYEGGYLATRQFHLALFKSS